MKQVHGEIEQVKDVMVHNIGMAILYFCLRKVCNGCPSEKLTDLYILLERVLERGERIELLVDKTDNLNQQAFAFKKRSTQLKVCFWFLL